VHWNFIFSFVAVPSVLAIRKGAITKLENLATRYLKKWLGLPRCATCAILYYPDICCTSLSQVSKEAKLSLLSCISTSGDPQLSELGLQLHLGDAYLQTQDLDYNILSKAYNCYHFLWPIHFTYYQRRYYQSSIWQTSRYPICSVQAKRFSVFRNLLRPYSAGMPPRPIFIHSSCSSDTLPTAVNLQRWNIQCDVKCPLCGCQQQLVFWIAVLWLCPRIFILINMTKFWVVLLVVVDSICIYADLRASKCPQGTIPSSLMVTSYRPDSHPQCN